MYSGISLHMRISIGTIAKSNDIIFCRNLPGSSVEIIPILLEKEETRNEIHRCAAIFEIESPINSQQFIGFAVNFVQRKILIAAFTMGEWRELAGLLIYFKHALDIWIVWCRNGREDFIRSKRFRQHLLERRKPFHPAQFFQFLIRFLEISTKTFFQIVTQNSLDEQRIVMAELNQWYGDAWPFDLFEFVHILWQLHFFDHRQNCFIPIRRHMICITQVRNQSQRLKQRQWVVGHFPANEFQKLDAAKFLWIKKKRLGSEWNGSAIWLMDHLRIWRVSCESNKPEWHHNRHASLVAHNFRRISRQTAPHRSWFYTNIPEVCWFRPGSMMRPTPIGGISSAMVRCAYWYIWFSTTIWWFEWHVFGLFRRYSFATRSPHQRRLAGMFARSYLQWNSMLRTIRQCCRNRCDPDSWFDTPSAESASAFRGAHLVDGRGTISAPSYPAQRCLRASMWTPDVAQHAESTVSNRAWRAAPIFARFSASSPKCSTPMTDLLINSFWLIRPARRSSDAPEWLKIRMDFECTFAEDRSKFRQCRSSSMRSVRVVSARALPVDAQHSMQTIVPHLKVIAWNWRMGRMGRTITVILSPRTAIKLSCPRWWFYLAAKYDDSP